MLCRGNCCFIYRNLLRASDKTFHSTQECGKFLGERQSCSKSTDLNDGAVQRNPSQTLQELAANVKRFNFLLVERNSKMANRYSDKESGIRNALSAKVRKALEMQLAVPFSNFKLQF